MTLTRDLRERLGLPWKLLVFQLALSEYLGHGSLTIAHFPITSNRRVIMNDPGLDEPAQEAAQDVEKLKHEEDEEAEKEEQEYLDPR